MDTGSRFIKDREDIIEEPFDGDLWERKQLAEKLTHFISNLKCGATIALDAEWGAGKTWFVKNWKADLEKKDYKVIYIDAFSHDFMDDPFLILSMEILEKVNEDEVRSSCFKEKLIGAYHAVLPNLPILIWSLAMTLIGGGHLSKTIQSTFESVKDTTGEVGEKVGALLEENLREHLSGLVESYNTNKNELKYFREALSGLVETMNLPLIFIIDELDRCKPEFSIKLIERIKHFFDIPNIVFILSTNKSQLEESINSFYGFKTANSYLEKFIDLNLKFPNREVENYEYVIKSYLQKFNLKLRTDEIVTLSKVFNLNSRDILRILQKISLLKYFPHVSSLTIAFIYLAMDQKSMNPGKMSERDFLDNFVRLLGEYTKSKHRLMGDYDYDNLVNFAKQYNDNGDYESGLYYLLKYYYVTYTDNKLEGHEETIRNAKSNLMAHRGNNSRDFVKSWHNYINSGFIVD